jgi:hypothetical protein
MALREFVEICTQELEKAGHAIALAYEAIREADQRVLAFLLTILRR